MELESFDKPTCIQDITHIGTKLKTRFLKPNVCLPMGKYFAESQHLHDLIGSFPKSCHFLTSSMLNPTDKMNFKSVVLIISESVEKCLSEKIGTLGTRIFLKIIRFVLDSFLDKSLNIIERNHKIWYSVFLLRQWRQWIKNSKKYN